MDPVELAGKVEGVLVVVVGVADCRCDGGLPTADRRWVEGVDLALRATPNLKDSTLQARTFGSAPLTLFAATSYLDKRGTPAVPADLAGHEILVHSRFPPHLLMMSSAGESFELVPSGRIRADDMQTLRALALRGAGIALLPDFPGGSGDLVRVLDGFGTQSGALHFVFPGGKFTPTTVRAFIDLAVEMRRN